MAETSLTLLYAGRVSREKSLDLLSEAFRTLVDEGVDLTLAIIGDGPYREEMESGLKGYPVVFTGYLSGIDLVRGYASADLFVFPSATDTFGNVVLEAQASGLSVVVSDQGGPHELMLPGKTGLVFRAGDRNSLIEAIRTLVSDREALATMGKQARRFTLVNGPDSSQTYNTILQIDSSQLIQDEYATLANAAL